MLPFGLLLFVSASAFTFFGAQVEPSNGQVRIYQASGDQPLNVDWTAVARRKFPRLDPKHPAREMLRSLLAIPSDARWMGIPISGQVPSALASKHFYLFAMEGVIALRLASVEGRITLDGDDSVRLGGELAAVSAERFVHGGFALQSDQPLSIRSEAVPAARIITKTGDSMTYHSAGQGLTTVMAAIPAPASDAPVAVRRFDIGSESFLMVQWRVSPDTCEFAFTLFRLSANEIREVQWVAYNCDV